MWNKLTKVLIYATIFLLPIYLVRFSIFGFPTNALEILMLAVFASWFFSARPGVKLDKKYAISIGLIFFGLLLSTLVNKNYAVGFGIIKSWFVLPLLFSWIAIAVIPEEKRKNVFFIYYFSALAVAIISLGYYISGAITFDRRLQGIFNSPNYLAMYLSPAIILGLWLSKVQSSKFKVQKFNTKLKIILSVFSLAIILLVFYLTYSYAAWLAVAASLAITYFIKNKKISWRLMAVAGLILLAIFVSQQNTQKFQNLEKYTRSSIDSRTMIWRAAAKILGDNIVFGIGPGNFQDKYLEYQKYFPPYLEWAVPHPHNLYLAWWLYGGILSFIGFVELIFFWLKEMLAKEKNSRWAISFAIMLYFLLHGLADTTYFKNDLAVIFWITFFIPLQLKQFWAYSSRNPSAR